MIDQLSEMPSHMDTPGSEDLPSMSDELALAGSCQPSPVDSQTKRASKPHSDLAIAMTTLSSSQSDIPETVTGDDTFRAHPSSSREICAPTNTEKRSLLQRPIGVHLSICETMSLSENTTDS